MRYVSSIASSTYNRLGGYEVKGTSGGRGAKLKMAREQVVPVDEQNKLHEHQHEGEPREQSGVLEERRKASRRVSRQSLLLDLRSRIDRRRRNLRDGDIVEHIDEEA